MKKATAFKFAILFLFTVCAILIGFSVVFQNDSLSISGLLAFTAASGLLTYYAVNTQPNQSEQPK